METPRRGGLELILRRSGRNGTHDDTSVMSRPWGADRIAPDHLLDHMVRDHIQTGLQEAEMRRFCVAAMALAALGSPVLAADPTGDWLVADKTAVIRIEPCGPTFCGIIAWTRDAPGLDENNPEPAKRSRSVLGVEILI